MKNEPLTAYYEAKTILDAIDFISLKHDTEGWELLMPPQLIPISIRSGPGCIVSLSGYSFILHKFNKQDT